MAITSQHLLLIHEARTQLRKRISEAVGLSWDDKFSHDDDFWHEQQSLVQSIAMQQDTSIAPYIMALRVNYADHKRRIIQDEIINKSQVAITAIRRNPGSTGIPEASPPPASATDPALSLSVKGPGSLPPSIRVDGDVKIPSSRVMDILGKIPSD